MRIITPLLIASLTLLTALPATARERHSPTRYAYHGHVYNSLASCQAAKRKARKDGTIVGAAVAGVGAAVLGANLGESALIAGGGAVVGNQLGDRKKC